MHSICQKKTNETGSLKNRSYICLLFIFAFFFSLRVNAATFTVSNTNDAGAGSFRQAIIDANANLGADLIDATGVTGTISLLSLLPNITESVTITGPGMTLLTINQTIDRRIFTTGAGAVIFVLRDLTLNFSGPGAVPYAGGGGAILAGGAGAATTLTNVAITNFRFQVGNGGAISQSSALNVHILTITNCLFTNNKCGGAGGAVSYNGLGTATITGCTFSGNQTGVVGAGTGGDGGAIATTGGGVGGTYLIEKNTFLNNQVLNSSGHAGAITNTNGTSTIRFNRFIGNTCANVANPPLANIIAQGAGATVNITIANNNWWGVNTGPGANDAASLGAGGTMILTKWLQLKTTASPNPICTTASGPGNTSTVTTSFLSNSANETIAVSDLTVLIGLPVTWTSTLGSLSGQQTTIQASGTATALFTSNGTGGTATVNAQVDNVPASETSPARASITVNTSSTAPTGATGITTICNGSSTTLTVDGGSKGAGATTEWFSGSCGGTPEGTGDAIIVSPTTTTTYYVRYNGTCNTTDCATVTVTVNDPSVAPSSISGTTTICNGSSTTLTAVGGTLGTGANYQWGTGAVVGTSPIGGATNSTLIVSPASTTTYWVRIENTSAPCPANTSGVTQVVTVNQPSVAPTGATGTTTICNGSSTTLTVDGGSKGTGAITEWFTGSCEGTPEGTGDAIIVSPTTTTTYYVRYNGTCNTTTCATVTVTVNTLSTAPTGATGTTTICSGSGTTLTVDGGSKGTGATTEWFTGSCGGTPAGTGDAINVSPASTTTYYVRYTGTCNTTTCASVTVTVNPYPTVNAPTVVQPTCNTPTGTITVNATGSGTLEYSIDGGANWFITNVFSGLAPGSYNIAVRSQSAASCVANYSGNPVILTAATNCCSATCSNNNPTLYFGYPGDQTATVQATATGGTAPYTVQITMNRPLNCNVINSSGDELWTAASGTSVNNVCPVSGPGLLPPVSTGTVAVSGGSYSVNVTLMQDATFTATITDANGCVSTCTTFIHAEDVRCFAGNGGNAKVSICHQTGNNNNPCTNMCVNQSAVAGHLAHGDFVGNCTEDCTAPVSARGEVPVFTNGAVTNVVVTNGAASKGAVIEKAPVSLDKFQVRVIPNPTENQFTLVVESGNNEKIVVLVYDVLGRIVKHIEKSDGQLIRFGEDMKNGSYLAVVRQGNKTTTIKLVKQ